MQLTVPHASEPMLSQLMESIDPEALTRIFAILEAEGFETSAITPPKPGSVPPSHCTSHPPSVPPSNCTSHPPSVPPSHCTSHPPAACKFLCKQVTHC